MGNIPSDQVICKCLDLLDIDSKRLDFLDYRIRKLTVASFVKLMIEAQLKQHLSYFDIIEHLRSSTVLQEYRGLQSISESQLSRKLRTLPYPYSQQLFLNAVCKLQELTRDGKGIPGLDRLRIIDSCTATSRDGPSKTSGLWHGSSSATRPRSCANGRFRKARRCFGTRMSNA